MVRIVTLSDHEFFFLMERDEWSGKPFQFGPELERKRPFERVSVTCTNSRTCWSRSQCSAELRRIQMDHQDELYPVGGYGTVYEGRGWHTLSEPIQDTKHSTMCIAYIGQFDGEKIFRRGTPPYEMLTAVLTLIKHGLKFGHISPKYSVVHEMPSTWYNERPQIDEYQNSNLIE